MRRMLRFVCVVLFVIGTVTYSRTQVPGLRPLEARSYAVVTEHYHVNANGSRSNRTQRIRYVKANDEWRQQAYSGGSPNDPVPLDMNSTAVFAGTADGFFAIAPGRTERKFISSAPNEQMKECFRSVRCLEGQKSFVRTDEVADLQVYVLRNNIEDALYPIAWTEKSYSPETGYLPLRTVNHFRDGSEDVMQATAVIFREIPDNLNDDIEALPVRK